mgnify:CR=1 FL=1
MTTSARSDQILQIPIDRIACAPQVRESVDAKALAGLTQSLREVGLIHPVLVRPDGESWCMLDGHRRLAAARQCGWATISAIVAEADLSEADVVERQLLSAVQRAGLSPMERARAIDRLIKETGWSGARVATRLGLSPASVSKLLALLVLPAQAQADVEKGELAASTAYEIVRTVDASDRSRLLEEAARGRVTRDQVTLRRRGQGGRKLGRRSGTRSQAGRDRIVIPVGEGGSVTIAGSALSTAGVIPWIEQLLEGLRRSAATSGDIRQFARECRARVGAGGGQ